MHTATNKSYNMPFIFFLIFFFPRIPPSSWWLSPKNCVFIGPFCAPHHNTEHHVWSVSPQEAPLPSLRAPSLAPLAQQDSSHQERTRDCHCFHPLHFQGLAPPQSLPFPPRTTSPNFHNQGVSIHFCFLSLLLSTVLCFFLFFHSHVQSQLLVR